MPRHPGARRSATSLATLAVAVVLLAIAPGNSSAVPTASLVGQAALGSERAAAGRAETASSARITLAVAGRSSTPPPSEQLWARVAELPEPALPLAESQRLLLAETTEASRQQHTLAARRASAEARAQAAEAAREKAAAELQAREEAARVAREAARYSGRNHFWYPTLGIEHSVSWFPCERSRAPDDLVYRWGCAGSGNVYLLAHAYGWFKPLNQAYYSGRLKPGQLVAYADGDGRTRFYRLDWWRVTPPLASSSWAWAGQSRSSLTLQTCVGANSELRLFVRFHEVPAP